MATAGVRSASLAGILVLVLALQASGRPVPPAPALDAPLPEKVDYLLARWLSEEPNARALWSFEHAMAADDDFDAAMRGHADFSEFQDRVLATFGRDVGGPDEERDAFEAEVKAAKEEQDAERERLQDPEVQRKMMEQQVDHVITRFLADASANREVVWTIERRALRESKSLATFRRHAKFGSFNNKVRKIVGRAFAEADAERDADPALKADRFEFARDMPATDISGLVREYMVPHKLFDVARQATESSARHQFSEAIAAVDEASALLSQWRQQLTNLQNGEAPVDFDDGRALSVDTSEGKSYDTSEAFSFQTLSQPHECKDKSRAGNDALLRITYVGKLAATGQTFISTLDRRTGLPFLLGADDNLPALNRGLMGSCALERRVIVVPPADGYGDAGLEGDDGVVLVPPGATLKFYVDVLSVLPKPEGEL